MLGHSGQSDAARRAVSFHTSAVYIAPNHKCTVLPIISDQCQMMTDQLLHLSDQTKILTGAYYVYVSDSVCVYDMRLVPTFTVVGF